MSLLWPDKLQATVCPDRIELIRSSGGLRSRILESETIPCAIQDDSPPWMAPVAALKHYLDALPSTHNVTVTLSNHFVHYTLVPWSDALVNDEERRSLARICFEKIYGDMARHWSLRVGHAAYGQPCIASAIDQPLLDGIQNASAGSQSRLASLQPSLMTALNRFRKQFKGKDFTVLVAEPNHVCLLRGGQNGITEIKTLAIGANLPAELDLLMTRESIMHASPISARPYLIANGYARSAITAEISGKFEVLECNPSPSHATRRIEMSNVPATGISG